MGFFSALQNIFKPAPEKEHVAYHNASLSEEEQVELLDKIRSVSSDISSWVDVIVTYAPSTEERLYASLDFLCTHLNVEEEQRKDFIVTLSTWANEMGYHQTADIRSELVYRLHTLLGIEDAFESEHSLFEFISQGLSKTRAIFTHQLQKVLLDTKELDEAFWENIETIFLAADMGYTATQHVIEELQRRITRKEDFFVELEKILQEIFDCKHRLVLQTKPTVIMVVGINGAGKTTTVAKLANIYQKSGKKVMVIAGDTFRVAAIEQLEVWSNRLGVGFFAKEHGSDAASVAFEGIQKAQEENYDIVLVDTAGRLHTKTNLMEELSKVYRVIKKCIPEAPHSVMLVLDATIGQNALSQTDLFNKACPLDEIIFTKLDGTAKGGIAIAVALQYKIPITYIGLGEKIEDLREFDAIQFTKALLE